MERDILRDSYAKRPEFITDLSNHEMQQRAQIICDTADRLFDDNIIVGEVLRLGALHFDDGTHVSRQRDFSIEDDGLFVTTKIRYTCHRRYDTEFYDITTTVSAETDRGWEHLNPSTYQLHRTGDRVSYVNQVMYDSYEGSLIPASLGDLYAIQDGLFAIIHASEQGSGHL